MKIILVIQHKFRQRWSFLIKFSTVNHKIEMFAAFLKVILCIHVQAGLILGEV